MKKVISFINVHPYCYVKSDNTLHDLLISSFGKNQTKNYTTEDFQGVFLQ
jgi:hypothetical protein